MHPTDEIPQSVTQWLFYSDKVEQLLQGHGDKKLSELKDCTASAASQIILAQKKAQPDRSASGKKFIVFGNTD